MKIRYFVLLMIMAWPLTNMAYSATQKLQQSPWPVFRGDQQNSGFQPLTPKVDQSLEPWSFQTAKGIFSTPIIDQQGNIYVGSADTYFYSLAPDGNLRWSFKTGEIIDSAAALSTDGEATFLTIPSGDGFLYHGEIQDQGFDVLWTFDSRQFPHAQGKGYNWFEGNVMISPQGHLYAGSTNWNFYALNTDGTLRWIFPAHNMNWSAAAFDDQGDLYWSSLDFRIRKMTAQGESVWNQFTYGFNVGSIALHQKTAFATSFDGRIYALDQKNGKVIWKVKTGDHVYSSVAIDKSGPDADALYATSTDGNLYKISLRGEVLWRYDAGDVIRSSPVIGRSPSDPAKTVIYFGSGNGKIFAINDDGSLRWSFDTTPDDQATGLRNDLNASPALGETGVYIAGEHGYLWFVPYDYPLHTNDPRAQTSPSQREDGVEARWLSPGSNLMPKDYIPEVPAASSLAIRILHTKNSERLPSHLDVKSAQPPVSIEPSVDFKWEVSHDGSTIFIVPTSHFAPDTTYQVKIEGLMRWGGFKLGGFGLGAIHQEPIAQTLTFTTKPSLDSMNANQLDQECFEMYRLAIPEPSMIPSLNQIGFDSYHWLICPIDVRAKDGAQKVTAYIVGSALDRAGKPVPQVGSEFRFAMDGTIVGDQITLHGENLVADIAGISMKLAKLEFRGQIESPLHISQGSLYAETGFFSDWVYGPALAFMGLMNPSGKLPMAGTFLSRPYEKPEDSLTKGTLISKSRPTFWQEGQLVFRLDNHQKLDEPIGVILRQHEQGDVIPLAYPSLIDIKGDTNSMVHFRIPKGTSLGQKTDIILMIGTRPTKFLGTKI